MKRTVPRAHEVEKREREEHKKKAQERISLILFGSSQRMMRAVSARVKISFLGRLFLVLRARESCSYYSLLSLSLLFIYTYSRTYSLRLAPSLLPFFSSHVF